MGIGDIQVLLRHLQEVLRLGIKQPPDGEHGMDVFIVELLEFAGNVGEIGIEDRITF